MVRQGTLASVCALFLWLGGCPKRQETRTALVYVPATPAAPAPPVEKPQPLVIEEPAPPPEPEEAPAAKAPEVTPPHHTRRPPRSGVPAEPEETPAPETPPTEVPALEPRESRAETTELRRQYQTLEQDIRQRLARLNGSQLSANDRKTMEDAQAFFAQATHALASGDLQRALNLAHKASLLLAALQ